jgi:hypothetical protein
MAKTAEVFKCAHCHAPLPVSQGPVVVCEFCNTENRVQEPEPPPPPAPPPMPPPVQAWPGTAPPVQPWPGTGFAHVPQRRFNPVGCVVAGVALALVFVGGITAVVFRAASPSRPYTYTPPVPVTATPPVPMGPTIYGFQDDEFCLVHADGDSVPDPMGRVTMSGGAAIAAIDGKSGSLLYNVAQPYEQRTQWCAGPDAYLYAYASFALERIDVRTGKAMWKVKLSDTVDELGVTETCLTAKTSDGKLHHRSMVSGAPVPACKPPVMRKRIFIEKRAMREAMQVGDIRIKLGTTGRGTSRYELTAVKGGRQIWKKTYEITRMMTEEYGAAGPDGVLLLGAKPGEEEMATWQYVKADSGDVAWTKEAKRSTTASTGGIEIDGKYAYLVYDDVLVSLDLKDGREKWRFGQRF